MAEGIHHTGAFWKPLMPLILMLLSRCIPAFALDITLQWDANTETDLLNPGFSDLTEMEPGIGYWIETSSACT